MEPSVDSGRALALFLKQLGEKTFDGPALGGFLEASEELPLDLPLLGEMREFRLLSGAMTAHGTAARGVSASHGTAGAVPAKLERRYQRLCFVQESLEHIDFKKAKPGQGFEEFMLGQTDFSRYASLDKQFFNGLFIDGLDDYPDSFFTSAFRMNRKAIRTLVLASYAEKAGSLALIKNNLFILSVMRTLHSSLDFASLWDKEAVLNELGGVLAFFTERRIIDTGPSAVLKEKGGEVFVCLLSLFHHAEYRHDDGVKTGLFLAPFRGCICLAGSFKPLGKAHSLALVSSGLPCGALSLTESPKDLAALGQGLCIRNQDGRLTLAKGPGA
jgi:hypothetical protein